MKRWAELVGAFTLLTRLPVGGFVATHPPSADCVWAYPVVGLAAGGLAGLLLHGLQQAGMPQPLAVLWALAAYVLLTGALHEDGLADTVDGFGGGGTVARKLEIMRDSRIGSFGALALVFSVAVRAIALALSARPELALILTAILGRGAMLLPLVLLRPARVDGLAAVLGGGTARAWTGLLLAALAGVFAPRAALAALAGGLGMTLLARRQVGGYTGDVFGAAEQVAECACLSVLAA